MAFMSLGSPSSPFSNPHKYTGFSFLQVSLITSVFTTKYLWTSVDKTGREKGVWRKAKKHQSCGQLYANRWGGEAEKISTGSLQLIPFQMSLPETTYAMVKCIKPAPHTHEFFLQCRLFTEHLGFQTIDNQYNAGSGRCPHRTQKFSGRLSWILLE